MDLNRFIRLTCGVLLSALCLCACPAWDWAFDNKVEGLALYHLSEAALALSTVVQDPDSTETLALFGAHSEDGLLLQVGGVCYTGVAGTWVTVYQGEDGRPSLLASDDGWRICFEDYGTDTVSIRVSNPSGGDFFFPEEALPADLCEDPLPQGETDLVQQIAAGRDLLHRALRQFDLVLPFLALWPPAFVTHGVTVDMPFFEKLDKLTGRGNDTIRLAAKAVTLAALEQALVRGDSLAPTLLAQTEQVSEGSLIGRWRVSDTARPTWSMEVLLYPDGSFLYTELEAETPLYTGSGQWSYSAADQDFSWRIREAEEAKCFQLPTPSCQGLLRGDWDSFTVAGKQGDGEDTVFLWQRDLLDYGASVLVAVDGLSFPNTLLQLPDFLQEENHHYVYNALLEMDLDLPAACIKSFPWTLDAFLSDMELGRLQRFLRQYYSLAKAQGGQFILVAHSWGTFLTYTALSLESRRPEPTKADLYITLSSPLGTPYAHEGELFAEELAISIFTEEWLGYLGRTACETCYLPVGEHDNYWFWGDPVSGPLQALSPTVQDIQLGEKGESDGPLYRNLVTFPLWHYHSSLMGGGPIDNSALRRRITTRINTFLADTASEAD